ncbi:MAG: EAL domain-containing protein [Acidimicrobiales bacterium]|nr:EAL domain-containing protein [Acidimicrobiales bacterium]
MLIERSMERLEDLNSADFNVELTSIFREFSETVGLIAIGEWTRNIGEGVLWFDPELTSMDELAACAEMFNPVAPVTAMTTLTSANGRTAAIVPNPPDSFAGFTMILASENDELTAGVASLCELISLAVSSARWRASLSGEPAVQRAGIQELVGSALRLEGDSSDDSEALDAVCELARSFFSLGTVSYWRADGSTYTLLNKGLLTTTGSLEDAAPSVEADLDAIRKYLENGHMIVPLSFFDSANELDHAADALALIVPTYGPDGPDGAVVFGNPSHREWSELDLQAAHAIAPSIHRTASRSQGLHKSLNRHDFNWALQRIAISAARMGFDEEEVFLHEVASTMITLLGLNAASVWRERDNEIERMFGLSAEGEKRTAERRAELDTRWVSRMHERGYAFIGEIEISGLAEVSLEDREILAVPLRADPKDPYLLALVGGRRQRWGKSELGGVAAIGKVVTQTLLRFEKERVAAERLQLEMLLTESAGLAVRARSEDIGDTFDRILVRITEFFGLAEAQAWGYKDDMAVMRNAHRPDGREGHVGLRVPYDPEEMSEKGWGVLPLGELPLPEIFDPPDTNVLLVTYRSGIEPQGMLAFIDLQNRRWSDDEISYVQKLASMLAQLSDRMTLTEMVTNGRLKRQRRSHEVLRQITAVFVDFETLNVDEALVASLEQVRSFIDCDSLALFELDHATHQIECSYESTRDDQPVQSPYGLFDRDDPAVARILDPTDGPDWRVGELFGTGDNSTRLHVVSVMDDRDILALSVVNRQGVSLDEESAQMLSLFLDILTQFRSRLALEENARLRVESDSVLREVAGDFVNRSVADVDEGIYEAMAKVGMLHACRSLGLWALDEELGGTRLLGWLADGIDESKAPPGYVAPDNPTLELVRGIESAKLFESPALHWDHTDKSRILCVAPIRVDGEVVACISSETFSELHELVDFGIQESLLGSIAALLSQLWDRLEVDRAMAEQLAMADLLRRLATFLAAISSDDLGGDERALDWLAGELGLEHLSLWGGVLVPSGMAVAMAGASSSTGAIAPNDMRNFVVSLDELELSFDETSGAWMLGEAPPRTQAMIKTLGYQGDYQVGFTRTEHSPSEQSYFVFARSGTESITENELSLLNSALMIVSQYLSRARAERALLVSFAESPVAISFRTSRFILISCNAAYEALTGRTEEELLGTTLDLVMSRDSAVDDWLSLGYDSRSFNSDHGLFSDREVEFHRPDGTIVWADVKSRMATIPGEIEPVVLTYAQDKTERRRSRQLLEYQASHDELTGLPNRRAFVDQANTELAGPNECAVLMIDLDRFKDINDLLGHSAGDQLLISCSDRIRLSLRPGDAVSRFGGDEFSVLLRGPVDPDAVSVVAERLLSLLREPVRIGSEKMYPSASVGIAIREEGDTVEDLLRFADAAMYAAKKSGRDNWVCFDHSMREAAIKTGRTETDLRHALDDDQLEVYYQPEFDLETGGIVGAEALVRWRHPEQGLLAASSFISLAEKIGMISRLGGWVIAQACTQAAAWVAEGHNIVIRVNISAQQLRRSLVGEVQGALAASKLPAGRLCLEMKESTIMDDVSESASLLEQIRQTGVQIAVDDFGTGLSSLAYLKRLPIDILKIDRTFVSSVGVDQESTDIVRSIVGLAQNLNLGVVAEGIEAESQIDELIRVGCHRGQGFHLSQPVPAEDMSLLFQVADSLE